MKVAVVIAKFASGWRALLVSENIAEVKAAFKAVKVEGALVDQDEAAEAVMFFDSSGNLRRKFLRSPEQLAAVESGREAFAAAETGKARKLIADAAKADGTAQAQAVAKKAVALIAAELAPGAAGTDDDDALELLAQENQALRVELDRTRAELAAARTNPALDSIAEAIAAQSAAPASVPNSDLPSPISDSAAAESSEDNPAVHFGDSAKPKKKK